MRSQVERRSVESVEILAGDLQVLVQIKDGAIETVGPVKLAEDKPYGPKGSTIMAAMTLHDFLRVAEVVDDLRIERKDNRKVCSAHGPIPEKYDTECPECDTALAAEAGDVG